jgi:molybdopterin molybdotransferase
MISVDQARVLIDSSVPRMSTRSINITSLQRSHVSGDHDHVLAKPIVADRQLPPMDRVTMDGVAIFRAAYNHGQRCFKITGCQRAGEPPLELKDADNDCFEVMTGAILPAGCDAVVRYEDLDIKDSIATIKQGVLVEEYMYVHRKGSDAATGDVLIEPGTRLGPAEWAVAASVGQVEITVVSKPRIALVATGDEVLPIDAIPRDFEIRGSNLYALTASMVQRGFPVASITHLKDDLTQMYDKLSELLDCHDVIVTTGGVSKGKYDFLPRVLTDLRVKKIFHQVAQRPGKPFWFGVGERGQLVFGLPGNPVSVLVGFYVHVLPALIKMSGGTYHRRVARLAAPLTFKPELTLFQPVRISIDSNGVMSAFPKTHNTSGDYIRLSATDGVIELPAMRQSFAEGEQLPFYSWSLNIC